MAPFRKGRSRGARSAMRGRNATSIRGKGRSGENLKAKSTFLSSRVEELAEEGSEDGHTSVQEENSELDALSEGGISDDDDIHDVKPYNALIQSLGSNVRTGEPPRKKLKTILESLSAVGSQSFEASVSQESVGEATDIDRSDEAEEDVQEATEEVEDATVQEEEDPLDPFEAHFANPAETSLAASIKEMSAGLLSPQRSEFYPNWKAVSIIPTMAKTRSDTSFDLCALPLRRKLEAPAGRNLPDLKTVYGPFASILFEYKDVLFCGRTTENARDLSKLVYLHVLNHIFKTRDKVIKNNARLARAGPAVDLELRDQGFTRPKVLILLPTRQACANAVETIISFCEPEQQENKKRFQEAYAQTGEDISPDKPKDFQELFAGNDDDMFRIGMKFTRKTVKLFSQFYNSDIILASPLGLRMALGTEDSKKQDYDFLSSIEILVIDQADALLMQNWDHVEFIFEHLNLQPKEAHGCDFGRARNWYLDGNAKYLRQSVVLSAYNTPELNKLYGRSMFNIAGKVKISKETYDGVMLQLGLQLKQTFLRFDTASPSMDPDARFRFFTNTVVPKLTKYSRTGSGRGQGILIFISSYMDFVRVRNFLATSSATQDVSFGSISEYTGVKEIARARSHFFSGRHSVLLYTGRAHHFRRLVIRGAKKVVMYGLPDNALFYQELVGGSLGSSVSEGMVDLDEASVVSIFSKWDALKLERIVGTQRFPLMLNDKGGDTFDFL